MAGMLEGDIIWLPAQSQEIMHAFWNVCFLSVE